MKRMIISMAVGMALALAAALPVSVVSAGEISARPFKERLTFRMARNVAGPGFVAGAIESAVRSVPIGRVVGRIGHTPFSIEIACQRSVNSDSLR